MTQVTRVVVDDDHPLIVDGIQSQLAPIPHIEVVGQSGGGEDALRLIGQLKPDVVLMDVTLPGINGIELARRLSSLSPEIAVIMLTMHEDDEYVIESVQAGARGYVLKSSGPDVLRQAIDTVAAGGTFFSPEVAGSLIRSYVEGERPERQTLAPRERQVLALIARGRMNKEIADELVLSVRTVETYRERLIRKLDLHSVAELTRYAITEGLVKLD
ncbi:MAG: response regulator transcription factor [Gemmatimonadetes bacterium]|nr:response regulator transcription factor [Gemmatimonadota bacterium]